MMNHRLGLRLFASITICFAGCETVSQVTVPFDAATWHKLYVQGLAANRNGGYITVDIGVREPVDRARLAYSLRKHIREGFTPSNQWPDYLGLTGRLQPPLREVEYWAYFLAKLDGVDFSLRTDQTIAERDEQIRMLIYN